VVEVLPPGFITTDELANAAEKPLGTLADNPNDVLPHPELSLSVTLTV
jgi:hypothetical protein